MKGLKTIVLVTGLTAAMGITSYAGEWKEETKDHWCYLNEDGGYLANCWSWIEDGEGNLRCYYFDDNGYCLLNTITPDGYQVDASGAWVVDGVVQKKEISKEENQMIRLKSGYYCLNGVDEIDSEGVIYQLYVDSDEATVIFSLEEFIYYGHTDRTYPMARGNCQYNSSNEYQLDKEMFARGNYTMKIVSESECDVYLDGENIGKYCYVQDLYRSLRY